MSRSAANDVLLLMMLAHVLGDFYLQSGAMAGRKGFDRASLLGHGLIYGVCMVTVMRCCVDGGFRVLWLALLGGAAHLAIDALKPRIARHGFVKRHSFLLDQGMHIASLLLLWLWLGGSLKPHEFPAGSPDGLPVRVLPLLVALLAVLKPVGCLIESGEIWDLGIAEKANDSGKRAHSGRMIGYLERLIILFLLINGQYGSIAFVLTAKSVARFKDLEKQINAEYYLIGTLLSVVSVFAVVLLVGLGGKAP
ncbi:MAG: DUF3307 domain-containing protein [Christensenellaceae bacterium]|nr:DUF3307 domain-containing protein [Christensenellaceae bacterium]MEA5064843.1 DUF3307 domain-containing protein [Eubacteriales bacterium]MEA5069008.1 DUF3307 domain-containing protein [Christensenellaceae bacterium]